MSCLLYFQICIPVLLTSENQWIQSTEQGIKFQKLFMENSTTKKLNEMYNKKESQLSWKTKGTMVKVTYCMKEELKSIKRVKSNMNKK